MEQKLVNHLIEGETVLWTGKPEFIVLDKTNRGFILAKTGIVLAAMVMFLVYYLNFVAETGAQLKVSVFFLVAALTALVILPEVLDANKLKKASYAATDRRLIVLIGNNVDSVEFGKIKAYRFSEDADGQISLLCGRRAMDSKPRLRRLYTILGARLTEDKSACDSFVMYGVPEANALEQLLSAKIKG